MGYFIDVFDKFLIHIHIKRPKQNIKQITYDYEMVHGLPNVGNVSFCHKDLKKGKTIK